MHSRARVGHRNESLNQALTTGRGVRGRAAGRVLSLVLALAGIAQVTLTGGCAGEREAAYSSAIRRDTPPSDFALALVVMGPTAATQNRAVIIPGRDGRPGSTTSIVTETAAAAPKPASSAAPGAKPVTVGGAQGGAGAPSIASSEPKPARYVLDPDWILRAGVGGGSRENYFPWQTRQLRAPQVQELWRKLAASGLLAPDHPGIVSRAPALPDPSRVETAETRSETTRYVLSYTVAGTRRLLVVGGSADEAASADAAKAREIADEFARLAWVSE